MGFVGSEERLLEEFKLAKAPNGSIAADDSSYATSVPGVFAAGDAAKQARDAAEDARIAVRNIRRDALSQLKDLVKEK